MVPVGAPGMGMRVDGWDWYLDVGGTCSQDDGMERAVCECMSCVILIELSIKEGGGHDLAIGVRYGGLFCRH